MPRGGKRPGAGRKKGYKEKGTLEKEAARELLREMVKAELQPMTYAQIQNAKGIKYLVMRNKKGGTFKVVTKEQAEALLTGEPLEDEIVEIWEKQPSVQAFTDLMDRTLDKPAQSMKIEAEMTLQLDQRIREAEKRLRKVRG